MKKLFALFMVLVLCTAVSGCSTYDEYETEKDSTNDYENYDNSKYEYDHLDDDDYSYFSNKYGNSTTRCAKSGCRNYIVSSGDSAYCAIHSNKCLECHCYIDGDAMYCMNCLTDALVK